MKKRLLAGIGLVLCLNIGLAEDETKKNTRIVCNNTSVEELFTKNRVIYGEDAFNVVCWYAKDTEEISARCRESRVEWSHTNTENIDIKTLIDIEKDFLLVIEKHYSAFLKKKFEEGKCKEIKLGD